MGPDESHRRASLATLIVGLSAAVFIVRLGGAGASWLPGVGTLAALYAVLALSAVVPDEFLTRRSLDGIMRRHGFAVAVVAVAALGVAIRLPHLNAELGHTPIDIDEQRLAENVRHFFITGELLHTTVEHYPGLVFWLFSAAAFLGYARLLSSGRAIPVELLPVERFVAWARLANVGVAVGIIALTALIGRRVFNARVGILAAAIVAVAPLSTATTLVVRNDPGMVLAVLGAVYCALVALEDHRLRWGLLAGAAAGVAGGIKYSSVFAIVPAAAGAYLGAPAARRAERLLLSCVACVAAVAVSNHFVWADVPTFLRQLSDQVAITGAGRWSSSANPAGMYVDVLAGRTGTGVVLFAAAVGYALFALARPRRRDLIFLAFPILYMWFMTHRPAQFARWVFPLLPFVAIAGTGALVSACEYVIAARPFRDKDTGLRREVPVLALSVAVLAAAVQPLAGAAADFSRRLATPTHTLAERWLAQHVHRGEPVLTEAGWLDLAAVPSVVRRVPDLRALLDGGVAACGGAAWVVVPETDFGHPTLTRLAFVQRFHASQGFGGNTGYDYEIYRVPGARTE